MQSNKIKALPHIYPGSAAYSVATVGCNLRCAFCQNWEISQWPKEHLPKRVIEGGRIKIQQPICPQLTALQGAIPSERIAPQVIVEAALDAATAAIAYTYTEPTVFYELAYDTAVLARQQGLKNIFVTSGDITEGPLRELAPVLDAANADLKFFKEESYRRISRVRLQPILDALRLYHESGVWVEVTTLVIPGVNDTDEKLQKMAEFVHAVGVLRPPGTSPNFSPPTRCSITPSRP